MARFDKTTMYMLSVYELVMLDYCSIPCNCALVKVLLMSTQAQFINRDGLMWTGTLT